MERDHFTTDGWNTVPRAGSRLPEPGFARKSGKRAHLVLLAGLGLLVGVLVLQYGTNFGSTQLAILEATLVAALSLLVVVRVTRNGFWSPATSLLLVILVFHFGLLPFWVLGLDPMLPRQSDVEWFDGPLTVRVLLLCSCGATAYAGGVVLSAIIAFGRRNHSSSAGHETEPVDSPLVETIADSSGALLIAGVGLWFWVVVAAGGPGLLLAPYQTFLAATSGSQVVLAYYVIGPALGLTCLAPVRGWRKFAVGSFVVFALFGFVLGLRGEVLFPLAVAVVVVAFRRRMPRLSLVAVGSVVGLSLISFSKIVRQTGLLSTNGNWLEMSPFAAIGELGSSIRVVAVVVRWHEVNGESFRFGDTYTGSVARAIEGLISPATRLPSGADFRLMNVEIMERQGAIGGSLIGEAFHNFGVLGTVVVLALFGLIFGYLSNSAPRTLTICAFVCIGVPVLNHVRNSFVPVIPSVVGTLSFLALVAGSYWLVGRWEKLRGGSAAQRHDH